MPKRPRYPVNKNRENSTGLARFLPDENKKAGVKPAFFRV